ncbi:hypothetical protein ACQZV8_02495 [Magnetococcales bacterium HHB-1]
MKLFVITTCSNRKRAKPCKELQARSLANNDYKLVAEMWGRTVSTALSETKTALLPASQLYCGRSFKEASTAAKKATGYFIISAGLGVFPVTRSIPAYSLTISGQSPDAVMTKFHQRIHPSQWWEALGVALKQPSPLAKLINGFPHAIVCMALPSVYFSMVQKDLLMLPESQRMQLRIFGPTKVKTVPASLRSQIMPYDARFDGPESPNPGTKSDFAARAMRHFIEHILPHSESKMDLDTHAMAVRQSLSSLPYPAQLNRKKVSDQHIQQLIYEIWDEAEGRSGVALRILRDKRHIACEQSRFAKLFRMIKKDFCNKS